MASKPGPQPGVYLWRGREYHGMRAVARAAGVRHSNVSYHLRVHGHLDLMGEDRRGAKNRGGSKPVAAAGRSWPNQRALAREIGRSDETVSRWIRDGHPDRLLSALMAADARKTADAMREAQMIDDIRKAAA